MTPTLTPTLASLARTAAESRPDSVIAGFPDQTLTAAQLLGEARRVAAQLRAHGVRAGSHVAVLLPNSAEAVCTIIGISLAGAVPVPLNTRYRSDELDFVLDHSDAVVLVTSSTRTTNDQGEVVDYLARALEALDAPGNGGSVPAPGLQVVLTWGAPHLESTSRAVARLDLAAPEQAATEIVVAADAPAIMLYTSGTTARPKGCLISNEALVRTCTEGAVRRLGLTAEDAIWNPAPLCHVSAYVSLVGALVSGATYVTAGHFDPGQTLDLLARERVTVAYANFPAFYFSLATLLAERAEGLPDLKVITTAAAPAEVERIRAAFPSALQLSVTGATELSGSLCISERTDTAHQRLHTAGRPIEGVAVSIRAVGTGAELAPDDVGELWVSGYCLFSGYHREMASPFQQEGGRDWYRTADLASRDADGRVAFRGRIKDMLKVGGENVSALEVESFLLQHPAVAVAAVIARQDDRLGEVPVAFVELEPGATATEDEIIEFCRGRIAGYKVPRAVRFVEEWPRSMTKIQKQKLRDLLVTAG